MNEKPKFLKNLGAKIVKKYTGLLKKRKGYHFFNSIDLLSYFIQLHYADACVLVLLDCQSAFAHIPKLNILKRDDYSTYLMGLENEYAVIEFADPSIAKDYAYSFPIDLKIPYLIFAQGKLMHSEIPRKIERS